MSFFGFGAFSTPVGQLIERATDNAASAGNLALHLEICDAINESDTGPKEAVAAIRKRFTGNSKNFHIINLTLTILETAVKNCGIRFHSKIAQKDFLSDMMKVVSAKNNPPTIVRERILGLIQYWADSFQGKPQLVGVVELYEQLKREGVEFPPVDLDNLAPVEAPARESPQQLQQPGQVSLTTGGGPSAVSSSHRQQHPAPARVPTGPLKPEQVAKLLSEMDIVRRNMDIMNEILSETEPGKGTPDDIQLLDELNRSLHSMQLRVAGLIERVTDEVVLEGTLVINDDLNSIFVRFDRWLKNDSAAKASASPETGTVTTGNVATTSLTEPSTTDATISYPNLDEPPPSYETTPQASEGGVGQLIDLGSDITAPPPTTQPSQSDIVAQLAQLGITNTAPTTQSPQQQQEQQQPPDEFDIFTQSRTAYGSSQGGSTYDDNMIEQTSSLSAALYGKTTPQGNIAAEENQGTNHFPEENIGTNDPITTLGTNHPPPPGDTDRESATSAEFEQFLAQRAAKGESLPAARSRPQMQKAEDQSDELFSL